MLKRLFLLALLAIAGGAGYYFGPLNERSVAQPNAPPPRSTAPPVLAATVAAKPMPVEIGTIGHVQTIASVAIRPRIDGAITKVLVSDGQEVKAGDVLFTLDDRQAQALLDQAQGTLTHDRAQLEYAKRQIERFKPLAEKNFLSREQFEQAQSNAAALAGTVQADEAQVANYRAQLSYTVIRAPIDGKIGTINIKQGNSVQANSTTPLATLNQMRPIYVSFAVPQRDLVEIQKAMADGPVKVTAIIPGDEDEPQEGRLAYIENAIDQTSNTLSVKASFANAGNRLWPGQFVNVVVTLRVQPDALVVPKMAVQTGQKGTYVFVIKKDDTVEPRPIAVDRDVGEETVVAKGLHAGERVVTTGQMRLTAGAQVDVRKSGAAPERPQS